MKLNDLLGKTTVSVEGGKIGDDELKIVFDDGTTLLLYHEQDCCEDVSINDIEGDWGDIIGSPLTFISEEINRNEEINDYETSTWTFYKFGTVKGWVDLRWVGTSNGYYSETVDIRINGLMID